MTHEKGTPRSLFYYSVGRAQEPGTPSVDTMELVSVLGDASLPDDSPGSYPSGAPAFRTGLNKGAEVFHRDEPDRGRQ